MKQHNILQRNKLTKQNSLKPVHNNYGQPNNVRMQPVRVGNHAVGTSPSYANQRIAVVQSSPQPNANPGGQPGQMTFAIQGQPGAGGNGEEAKIDYDNANIHQKDMQVPTSYVNMPYDYKGDNKSEESVSDSADEASEFSGDDSSGDDEGASDDDSDYSSQSEESR